MNSTLKLGILLYIFLFSITGIGLYFTSRPGYDEDVTEAFVINYIGEIGYNTLNLVVTTIIAFIILIGALSMFIGLCEQFPGKEASADE